MNVESLARTIAVLEQRPMPEHKPWPPEDIQRAVREHFLDYYSKDVIEMIHLLDYDLWHGPIEYLRASNGVEDCADNFGIRMETMERYSLSEAYQVIQDAFSDVTSVWVDGNSAYVTTEEPNWCGGEYCTECWNGCDPDCTYTHELCDAEHNPDEWYALDRKAALSCLLPREVLNHVF